MDWSEYTRNTYIGISSLEKALFYILIFSSIGYVALWYRGRARLWKQGQAVSDDRPWHKRFRTMRRFSLEQRKLPRHKFGGLFHIPMYIGFIVLFIGTTLLFINETTERVGFKFHKGLYFVVYEVTLDLFGLGVLFGCLLALYRRIVQKPPSLSRAPADLVSVLLLFVIVLTGYALESARIVVDSTPPQVAAWSFVGNAFAPAFMGLSVDGYGVIWWIHAVLIAAWIVSLAFGRTRHILLAPVVAYFKPAIQANVPPNVDIEQVEQGGAIGVNALSQFSRWHLMSLDACMGCGRCERACPATATGKTLNPKLIVEKLRDAMTKGSGDDLTHVISDDELFACTTCGACREECPVLIEHPIMIMEMRRHRVTEGNLRGTPAGALQRIGSQGNPWGLPPADRAKWADGLDIPTVAENPNFDILFWVGCAGAYDPRGQQTARAIATLLTKAGVNFAVLGPKEKCTGDTPRRLGEDLLFQDLAMQNVETLNAAKVKRIVAMCPHCMHTIKNEFGAFGGQYEVLHHTQLLAELIEQGKLPAPQDGGKTITYHDPCYLARVNGIHAAPRRALSGMKLNIIEAPRSKDKTFCCGAGGGRMWTEEPPSQRPGVQRADELLATNAETVAVGCPFCMIMISDSVKAKSETTQVKDIAELILEQIETPVR